MFRTAYERKKVEIQNQRYEQAEHEADYIETKTLTDVQIENILYALYSKFKDKEGKIDVDLLRIVAREDCGVHLGHNRAYRIKKQLKHHHPDTFFKNVNTSEQAPFFTTGLYLS